MRPALALHLCVLLLAAWPVLAADETLLSAAGDLYREGDFSAAAERYAEALSAGVDGPTVHFNLATALHRSDRAGEAIAHYLTAAAMAPRDDDIRANLERALQDRPAGPPAPPASWLHAVVARVVGAFTLSELALAAATGYWMAIAAVIALMLGKGSRRTARRLTGVLGVLCLLLTLLALLRWWSYHHVDRAVVAVERAELRTGPGESFEMVASVGEGWIVRVAREDSDWLEVVDEAEVRGWLPAEALSPTGPGKAGDAR